MPELALSSTANVPLAFSFNKKKRQMLVFIHRRQAAALDRMAERAPDQLLEVFDTPSCLPGSP